LELFFSYRKRYILLNSQIDLLRKTYELIRIENLSRYIEFSDANLGTYSNVKHQRNNHFHEANLKNTIHAVGALLLAVIYYYKFAFSKEAGHQIDFRETTSQLKPEASFLRINADYY